jgi:hypothetical protein
MVLVCGCSALRREAVPGLQRVGRGITAPAQARRSPPLARRRAGADAVVAVERARHLCEAAEEALALCGGNVRVVHKDARFLRLRGSAGDLEHPADVIVFEVREVGMPMYVRPPRGRLRAISNQADRQRADQTCMSCAITLPIRRCSTAA